MYYNPHVHLLKHLHTDKICVYKSFATNTIGNYVRMYMLCFLILGN